MNEIIVAYCGLCCTNCGMYIKGKCKGCHSAKPMNRKCKMKACASTRGYSTCAACTDFENFRDCRKLYNLTSRFFGLIFNSDRIGNLNKIKSGGLESFKLYKSQEGKI